MDVWLIVPLALVAWLLAGLPLGMVIGRLLAREESLPVIRTGAAGGAFVGLPKLDALAEAS